MWKNKRKEYTPDDMLRIYNRIVKMHADVITNAVDFSTSLERTVAVVLQEICLRTPKDIPCGRTNGDRCKHMMDSLTQLNTSLASMLFIMQCTNSRKAIEKIVLLPLQTSMSKYMCWEITEHQFYAEILQTLEQGAQEFIDVPELSIKAVNALTAAVNMYELLMRHSPTPYIVARMFIFLTEEIQHQYGLSMAVAKRHADKMGNNM